MGCLVCVVHSTSHLTSFLTLMQTSYDNMSVRTISQKQRQKFCYFEPSEELLFLLVAIADHVIIEELFRQGILNVVRCVLYIHQKYGFARKRIEPFIFRYGHAESRGIVASIPPHSSVEVVGPESKLNPFRVTHFERHPMCQVHQSYEQLMKFQHVQRRQHVVGKRLMNIACQWYGPIDCLDEMCTFGGCQALQTTGFGATKDSSRNFDYRTFVMAEHPTCDNHICH